MYLNLKNDFRDFFNKGTLKYFLLVILFTMELLVAAQELKQDVVIQSDYPIKITDALFTQDGKCLISSGKDNLIKLWSVGTGKIMRTYRGHSKPISCLAMMPDEIGRAHV